MTTPTTTPPRQCQCEMCRDDYRVKSIILAQLNQNQMTTPDTKTPRTCASCNDDCHNKARTLERELNEAREELASLKEDYSTALEELNKSRSLAIERLHGIEEVARELTDLQPHIPQACYPGHEKFIDTHVDAARRILKELSPKT